MEPTHDPAAGPDAAPAGLGELILQNGKLKGASRPLTAPLTLIGRSAGCDLRLGADDVLPVHCALLAGEGGWEVRNFAGPEGVKVNGVPATQGPIGDGDLLEVHRFHFIVRIERATPAQALAEALERTEREKQALRIQAAAVAAQQAALVDQEAEILERRAALEQQEQQLAGHLENKRRKLIELGAQTREALTALRAQREQHAVRLRADEQERSAVWREVADGLESIRVERKHLQRFHVRLKKRWHRSWAAERAALTRRDAELTRQLRNLEADRISLRGEGAELTAARLRFNGEAELGRRQLEDAAATFRLEKAREEERLARAAVESRERLAHLDSREAALAEADRDLTDRQQHWQRWRVQLEREIEGLENRARNNRRNLSALEREAGAPLAPSAAAPLLPPPLANPVADAAPAEPRLVQVERLAEELADQRLELVEQAQRVVSAELFWRREREEIAATMEAAAEELQAREAAAVEREARAAATDAHLRQRQEDVVLAQRRLEGGLARIAGREAHWHGERDRLTGAVQSREKLAEQRLALVAQVARRWGLRQERDRAQRTAERTAVDKLRRELTALRDDWQRRVAEVQEAQRRVAQRALALEQYRQEYVAQAESPAVAARRLHRLKAQWSAQSQAARKTLDEQRRAVRAEAEALDDSHAQLQQQTAELTARETALAEQERAWDTRQLRQQDEVLRLRAELAAHKAHRERCEKQLIDYAEEVERLARFLLDEAEPPPLLTMAQAA